MPVTAAIAVTTAARASQKSQVIVPDRATSKPTTQEALMCVRVFCTIVTLLSSAALAQQPAAQNAAPAVKLFASSADVTAMIAKAKSERKPDQPNFAQPIVQLAPY